jgi:hypothetical protein
LVENREGRTNKAINRGGKIQETPAETREGMFFSEKHAS